MNMATISSDRNLKELRQLYDHTEAHVRSLRSLGIEAASYGALLSPVLLTKLPPDLRLVVSRKVSDSNLDMDALLTTFEEELTARERANPQPPRRTLEKLHLTYSLAPTTQGLNLSVATASSLIHPQAAPLLLIWLLASRPSGRCFNCLHRCHVSRECKSTFRCQKCKWKHHTSICDAGRSQPVVSSAPPIKSGLHPEAPPYQSTCITSTVQTAFTLYFSRRLVQ